MLPLDSPRWSELDTFFDKPEGVPRVLMEWVIALGFDREMTIYSQNLFHLYLHQGTITNVAFAIVPWLVNHLSLTSVENRIEYLSDVGLVEFRRQTCGVHHVRDGGDPEPDWLMPDYHAAIREAELMAEEILDEPHPEERIMELWTVYPALCGNAAEAGKRMYGEEWKPPESSEGG
jgi:hypothetical protein